MYLLCMMFECMEGIIPIQLKPANQIPSKFIVSSTSIDREELDHIMPV